MEDQYGGIPAEFRQLMAVRTELQQPQPLISPAHHLGEAPYTVHSSNYQQQYSYGQTSSLCGVGLVEHQFGSGQHINMSGSNGVALYHDLESSSGTGGLWMSSSNTNNNMGNYDNNMMNTTRWPRQETLTLLEIRSRLNPRFKDTNQKGPLWDQISRIMAEEHGYQRSGKKCKEKFENLYKYYKKTKEGKARKQDGKHYRFFRQLEAIYGHDQNSNIDQSPLLVDQTHHIIRPNSLLYQYPNKISDHNSLNSFSINNSSDQFETSSSDNNMNNKDEDQKMKGVGEIRGKKKSSWKAKVEEFVDSQMKKIMVTQESWMEKMFKNVIDKQEKRVAEEEECRKKEAARVDEKINEFWAKEKAWIEARDAAVMGAFNKLTDGKGSSLLQLPSFPERSSNSSNIVRWNNEEEISSLIELVRSSSSSSSTSTNFNCLELGTTSSNNSTTSSVWEEIASKMSCLGFERSPSECKHKWESLSIYTNNESHKKRREEFNTTGRYSGNNNNNNQDYYNNHCELALMKQDDQRDHRIITGLRLMDDTTNTSNVAAGTSHMNNPTNCFNLLFGEEENLWEKYGSLKLGNKDRLNQL
ncbi:hypothetical protein CsatB_011279 [Cannabis sativa]